MFYYNNPLSNLLLIASVLILTILLTSKTEQDLIFDHQIELYQLKEGIHASTAELKEQNNWMPMTAKLGMSDKEIWLKAEITNNKPHDQGYILEAGNAITHYVSFLKANTDNLAVIQHTGNALPFNQRKIAIANPAIQLEIKPKKTETVFIKQRSNTPINFSVKAFEKNSYIKFVLAKQEKQAFNFGALTLLITVSIALYLLSRKKIFALYGVFLISRTGLESVGSGQAFQAMYPNTPELNYYLLPLLLATTLISLSKLLKSLILTGSKKESIDQGVIIMTLASLAGATLSYASTYIIIAISLVMVCIAYSLLSLSKKPRLKLSPENILILAISIQNALWGVELTGLIGVMNTNPVELHSITLVTEAIIFIGVLQNTFNVNRKKRAFAEHVATQQIKERKSVQKLLEYKAFHNSYNLPNELMVRKVFTDQLRDKGSSYGVVLVYTRLMRDLERTLGTASAAELSVNLAQHINELLKNYPSVICLEETEDQQVKTAALNDNTLLLLIHCDTEHRLQVICKNICNNLAEPIEFKNIKLDLNIRAGFVFANSEEVSNITVDDKHKYLEDLIRKARVAAKQNDINDTVFHGYKDKEDNYSPQKLELAGELKEAIKTDKLHMAYQPKIDLLTGKITGLEALLRWNHKDRPVNTEEFIRLAEQNGIIKPLTRWVINRTLKDFKQLSENSNDIQLSVNISVINLYDPGFVDNLFQALLIHNMDASRLTLEVTETSLLSNSQQESKSLKRIREAGISLSVDDYGTGYSGLSQIHTLNAQELKIDRSFIMKLGNNETSDKLVKASIDMAHDLGMSVVAEGVETEEIELALKTMGCDCVQGYLYSRPVSIEQIQKLL